MQILNKMLTKITEKSSKSWRLYKFFSNLLPTPTIIVRNIPIKIIIPLNQQGVWTSAKQWETREPETLDWIDSFDENGTFFDIGASFGNETLYAALKSKNTRDIVAFDVDLLSSHDLACNLLLNNITSVTQFYLPLSKQTECLSMKEPSQYTALSKQGITHIAYNTIGLPLDALIPLLKKEPRYIKIDVDGAEIAVLEGMKETLQNNSLESLLIEVSHETEHGVLSILKDAGFSITSHTQYTKSFETSNIIFRRNNI